MGWRGQGRGLMVHPGLPSWIPPAAGKRVAPKLSLHCIPQPEGFCRKGLSLGDWALHPIPLCTGQGLLQRCQFGVRKQAQSPSRGCSPGATCEQGPTYRQECRAASSPRDSWGGKRSLLSLSQASHKLARSKSLSHPVPPSLFHKGRVAILSILQALPGV